MLRGKVRVSGTIAAQRDGWPDTNGIAAARDQLLERGTTDVFHRDEVRRIYRPALFALGISSNSSAPYLRHPFVSSHVFGK